jgi:hypothetical protein
MYELFTITTRFSDKSCIFWHVVVQNVLKEQASYRKQQQQGDGGEEVPPGPKTELWVLVKVLFGGGGVQTQRKGAGSLALETT